MAIELKYRGGSGAVKSVNGMTGEVVLTAADVGAIANEELERLVTKEELESVNLANVDYVDNAVDNLDSEVSKAIGSLSDDVEAIGANVAAYDSRISAVEAELMGVTALVDAINGEVI